MLWLWFVIVAVASFYPTLGQTGSACGTLVSNSLHLFERRPGPVNAPRWSCSDVPSGDGLPTQCCCAENGQPPRCLPHIIIVGTQKSGSTALFGYLLLHPRFKPPVKKELHFLEKSTVNFNAFEQLQTYLRMINSTNLAKITGEATPSYMLSPVTGKLIAGLVPQAKVIAILRNPVDRLYSEYQMKVRRVERQFNMTADGAAAAAVFSNCTHQFRIVARSVSDAQLVSAGWKQCMFEQLTVHAPTFRAHMQGRRRESSSFSNCLLTIAKTDLPDSFDAMSTCFGKLYLQFEFVQPFEEMVTSEMGHIRDCIVPINERTGVVLSNGSTVPAPSVRFATNAPSCWPSGTDANIARDYLVRGIFYPQLVMLLQFVNPANLLILEDMELKQDPQATLDRVWSFTGLPHMNVRGVTSEDVHNRISEVYPTFEGSTGWRMSSEYAPMPTEIRSKLIEFFKPFNEELFAFLGRRFDWDQ